MSETIVCISLTIPTPMIDCNVGKIGKTHPPRCPENAFSEDFALCFSQLLSNGVNGVNWLT